MSKPKSPCKDCPDRSIVCHSFCNTYKAYTAEKTAYGKWEKKQQDIELYEAAVKHRLAKRGHTK